MERPAGRYEPDWAAADRFARGVQVRREFRPVLASPAGPDRLLAGIGPQRYPLQPPRGSGLPIHPQLDRGAGSEDSFEDRGRGGAGARGVLRDISAKLFRQPPSIPTRDIYGRSVSSPPRKNPNPRMESQCGQEYMISFLTKPEISR